MHYLLYICGAPYTPPPPPVVQHHYPPVHPATPPLSVFASPPPSPSPSVSASSCRNRRRVPSVCNSAALLQGATCCQCRLPGIINVTGQSDITHTFNRKAWEYFTIRENLICETTYFSHMSDCKTKWLSNEVANKMVLLRNATKVSLSTSQFCTV